MSLGSCIQGPPLVLGASKAEASKAAHCIISMEKTNHLIKIAEHELALNGKRSGKNETVDISLSLEDLRETADQLQKKVQSGLLKFMGKDSATASALKKAIGNEFLGLRLKCRALLIQIQQRVQQSLIAAVPFKQKMSRAKKGMH